MINMRQLHLNQSQWTIYNSLKIKYQNQWREIIFKRDKYKCRVCGSLNNLTLAHITPVSGFVTFSHHYNISLKEAIKGSYSWDNLITLCLTCHKSQHQQTSKKIEKLFIQLIKKRGWRSAGVKLTREGVKQNSKINNEKELSKAIVMRRDNYNKIRLKLIKYT